ncbi:MAG: Citryl-CoA lyase [Gammaproteobacteria bacterium]|nr:Citryl-CoA lyase [Gammaproteobacteria bacterium]
MKIGAQTHRTSAISASNADAIVVRGFDLTRQLIGHIGLTEHFWLLLTGALPTLAQRQILDATLVAIAEHGLVPSVQAARMTFAAAPESLQGAVAAGILGCGSVVLGSSEAAGQFFAAILDRAEQRLAIDDAARAVVLEYRQAGRAIPGYGHPLHSTGDPRAQRLLDVASQAGMQGRHADIARSVERLLPDLIGKALVLNVSGAIPAVLLDAGYPLGALRGVPILARTAGLIGHLLEEQLRPIGFVLSHAAGAAIEYDGVSPQGFVATHE